MKQKNISKLNRYTSLPVLLDLLKRKKLTLLNPASWEDKNDSEIILEYKKRTRIKNLFAICFSYGDETVHHWKTYSNGTCGCVIEFDAKKLFGTLDNVPNLKHRKVRYEKISEIKKRVPILKIDDLPFTKRWPYRCEDEYRVIVSTDKKVKFYDIDITLDVIKKITISQQMPEAIFQTIKEVLTSAKVFADVNRSTLYENEKWINQFKEK